MHRFITTATFRMAIILTSSENIFSEQKKRISMFHAPTEIDRFTHATQRNRVCCDVKLDLVVELAL